MRNFCRQSVAKIRLSFADLLTQEQRLKFWEADNYFSFFTDIKARYGVIPLLEDIIAKAEASFSDPNQAAHLRFGHDYIVEALATLLNINDMGTIPSKPEEAKLKLSGPFESWSLIFGDTNRLGRQDDGGSSAALAFDGFLFP